ncbi:hypothetical protein [Burkholderia sp. LA-2-3-30-S1-D2]|uniref:hypothetical protein n=1 Tax=Burkholderia sp. LA-2-3-30-S1-D2 TaxID=1637862 RepID=UPI00075A38E2|nr:hypothetical protein [Burkholderia sp. LA-2-3-30-S1-D2]AOI98136.1 hypothetical protein WS66_21025 [Burkholderia sp. LA-2-3-30-S1-D2]KVE15003.1 hypothetical protein WS66_10890 [Burkholderia sp. LA-2-3-30-S1-D2]
MKRSVYYYASGVLVGAIAVTAYRYVDWGSLKAADWAAWVQAVGAIAAIAGAYFLGERSASHQLKIATQTRDRELAERRSSLKAVLDEVYVRFKRIEPSLNDSGAFNYSAFTLVSEDQLSRTLDLLDQVPIFELDSGELTQAVLTIQAACMSLTRLVTQFKLHQKEKPNDYPGDDVATAFMRGSLKTLDETFGAVVRLTNGKYPELRPPSLF